MFKVIAKGFAFGLLVFLAILSSVLAWFFVKGGVAISAVPTLVFMAWAIAVAVRLWKNTKTPDSCLYRLMEDRRKQLEEDITTLQRALSIQAYEHKETIKKIRIDIKSWYCKGCALPEENEKLRAAVHPNEYYSVSGSEYLKFLNYKRGQ